MRRSSYAPIFRIAVLASACLCMAATSITTYNLGRQYARKYNGIGRDAAGHVYVGAGDVWGQTGAALFRYDPVRDSLVMLGNVRQASTVAQNWLTGDTPGKIHTNIHQAPDGAIWFATHSASEGTDYSGFRGGHLYRYDTLTGVMTDETAPAVAIPHQGILAIAPAFSRNTVYSVGYPDGDIWKFNTQTRTSVFLMKSGAKSGGISRNMFADNMGRLYYPYNNSFLCFDPSDSTRKVRGRGMSGVAQIAAMVTTPGSDTIYFINHGTYHIWRYVPSVDSVKDLGPANMGSDTFTVANLAARWDLQTFYYAPAQSRKLVAFDLRTLERKVAMTIPALTLTGSDGTDANGDVWFSTYGQIDDKAYKFGLGIPCMGCGQTDAVEAKTFARPQPGLSVSPNPARGFISIVITRATTPLTRLDIYNAMGARITSAIIQPTEPAIFSTAQLPPGVYSARIRMGGHSMTERFAVIR